MHPPSVGNPRKGLQTPEKAPKPIDTANHMPPFPFIKPSVNGLVTACWRAYVYLYELHGHVAKPPGHFEIQKNSSVMPTKNAYLKIFIFRNTRNMSEIANRWVLKYEKIHGGSLG